MGGKSNKRKAALYENSNTLLKIIWKKEKFSLRKIWFWTFVEYCVPYWVMSITSGHLRIAMPSSSSSPSTSSQQLVWSCSPFFTNSMISQLQVPAVIVIVSIILMLTFVLPKIIMFSYTKNPANTCIIEFTCFEDERQFLCLVHPADPPVRGEVERRPVFQPPALFIQLYFVWRWFLTWKLSALDSLYIFASFRVLPGFCRVWCYRVHVADQSENGRGSCLESGRTIFVKIDHYLRGRAVKPFSFSFSIFLKKNSGSAAEEIVFNLFFVNNFDIRMHGGNYPLLFPSCRSTRF